MLHSIRRRTAAKAGLLISMYMCQTLSLGYVFGCLPVIMRQQQMSLKSIGALFLLHLPWAFKFLYASWVDRLYLPSIGRRRSWIVPLQWVAAVILLCLSGTPPETHFTMMYLLVLLLHTVMATSDIAVDGYATDILHPHERAWGNTIQSGARFAGMMLGGGLMLFLHSSLGWQNVCIILSGTVMLLSLPATVHRELPPVNRAAVAKNDEIPSTFSFLKTPPARRLLPILILPTTFVFSGLQMRMPLFVDLGLDTRDLGTIMMHWAYPAGLAGTIFSGWLLNRIGEKSFLRLFSVIALLLAAYTLFCAVNKKIGLEQAAVVLSMDNILTGSIHVWAYTRIMGVSAGKHAGTGFAALSSLFIIVPLICSPMFGAVGDRWGFVTLYAILNVLMLAGSVIAEQLQRQTPGPGDRSGTSSAHRATL